MKTLITSLAILSLAACSAVPMDVQIEQKKREMKTEEVARSVDQLPSWCMEAKQNDDAIFSCGTSTSADLQFSFDKAELAAKTGLARRVNSMVSQKIKNFLLETGAAENSHTSVEAQNTTQDLVTEVTLSGYVVEKRIVVPQGINYRAYVLLKYPVGEANRLLVDKANKNQELETHLRASEAYRELEADIEAHKPQAAPQVPVEQEKL